MTLIDTNVLLDVVTNDPAWLHWSLSKLAAAAAIGIVAINPVVYAELSVRYLRIEQLEAALTTAGVDLAPLPRPALFLAGKAFQRYRQQGGTRTGVLPDFFIGAHAATAGIPLLTRDPGRYRTYFPTIELITP